MKTEPTGQASCDTQWRVAVAILWGLCFGFVLSGIFIRLSTDETTAARVLLNMGVTLLIVKGIIVFWREKKKKNEADEP